MKKILILISLMMMITALSSVNAEIIGCKSSTPAIWTNNINNGKTIEWDYNNSFNGTLDRLEIAVVENTWTTSGSWNYNLVTLYVNNTKIGTCSGYLSAYPSKPDYGLYKCLYWEGIDLDIATDMLVFEIQFNQTGLNNVAQYNYDQDQDGDKITMAGGSSINGIVDGTLNNYDFVYCLDYSPITQENETLPINASFNVCFYDEHTGTPLNYYRLDHTAEKEGDYCSASIGITMYLDTGNFTNIAYIPIQGYERVLCLHPGATWTCRIDDGELNGINVFGSGTNTIKGRLNGFPTVWEEYDEDMVIYDGGSLAIYLKRADAIDEDDIDNIVDEYNDTFGDFFIEFYDYDETCEYRVGDYPIIVYQFTNKFFNETPGYIYRIYDGDGHFYKQDTILFNGNETHGVINPTSGWTFPSEKSYHIRLFNIDSSGEPLLTVNVSTSIDVCAKDSTITPTDELFPPLGVALGGIIGLIVCGFLTLSPLIILHGLKSHQTIPPVTYALMCSLGIVVSVLLGFFPFWVVPFICIVALVFIGTKYLINSNTSGGP